jgi:hypothetical protein
MILNDLTSDNVHLSRAKMSEFSAISEIVNHGKMDIDKHVVFLDGRVVFKTDRTRPRHRRHRTCGGCRSEIVSLAWARLLACAQVWAALNEPIDAGASWCSGGPA